jgi:hypothetical protein
MIVWIFFHGGSGGDGLANLLEQSTNAVAIDKEKKWRIHQYVDLQVKFWQPNLQNNKQRLNRLSQLNNEQIHIANSDDQYLIITSHDILLNETFDIDTVDPKKHIKILLNPKNRHAMNRLFFIKNLINFDNTQQYGQVDTSVDLSNFDFVLESIPSTWTEMTMLINSIGLKLSYLDFCKYLDIASGKEIIQEPHIGYYESYVDNNIVKYKRVDKNK